MLSEAEVRRRRVGGAMAVAAGVLLLVLAVMAMTGKLGATKASDGVSDEAASAGATSGAAESGSGESGAEQSGAEQSESGESAPPASESESAPVTAPLTVLNAGGIAGLAAKGKQMFEAAGWQVTTTGNLSGNAVPNASTVYYPAGDQQAQAAADSLVKQFPQFTAKQAPTGLGHTGVVVVLTGDFTPGA